MPSAISVGRCVSDEGNARAGVIARVIVGPGQTVDLGDLLVEIG